MAEIAPKGSVEDTLKAAQAANIFIERHGVGTLTALDALLRLSWLPEIDVQLGREGDDETWPLKWSVIIFEIEIRNGRRLFNPIAVACEPTIEGAVSDIIKRPRIESLLKDSHAWRPDND